MQCSYVLPPTIVPPHTHKQHVVEHFGLVSPELDWPLFTDHQGDGETPLPLNQWVFRGHPNDSGGASEPTPCRPFTVVI